MGVKKVYIMLRSCTFPMNEWASRVLATFSTNKTANQLPYPSKKTGKLVVLMNSYAKVAHDLLMKVPTFMFSVGMININIYYAFFHFFFIQGYIVRLCIFSNFSYFE